MSKVGLNIFYIKFQIQSQKNIIFASNIYIHPLEGSILQRYLITLHIQPSILSWICHING